MRIDPSSTPASLSIARLLLAGSSRRAALLAGAPAENQARIERIASSTDSSPPPDDLRGRNLFEGERENSSSRFGPAAIFELTSVSTGDVPGPAAEQAAEQDDFGTRGFGQRALTDEERRQIDEFRRRDAEVRRHEAAHKAAAGPHARGGASFEYQTGPDGRRYAVSGEVQIDTSPIPGNPQATIAKMQQIRRAALAPAQPSATDRAVAAQAAETEREARAEITRRRTEPVSARDADRSFPNSSLTPPGAFLDLIA